MELAQAHDGEGLIQELHLRANEIESVLRAHSVDSGCGVEEASWTMDYTRMAHPGNSQTEQSPGAKPAYTSKTLTYCVAQTMRVPAALDPSEATLELVLVDNESSIRLCLVASRFNDNGAVSSDGVYAHSVNMNIVKKLWSSRPFQYSSAMNPAVAAIVVETLFDLYRSNNAAAAARDRKITLLDPTCGSGTFLAYAMASGADVVGWDTKERCVEGTKRNLDYLVGQDLMLASDSEYRVEEQDTTLAKPDEYDISRQSFDCIVANLPWGQNTPTYYEENTKILAAFKRLLRPGSPCAVISRDIDIQIELMRLGYDMLGTAFIPQSNFRLPKSKKRKRGVSKDGEEDRDSSTPGSTSRCVVTFAVTA